MPLLPLHAPHHRDLFSFRALAALGLLAVYLGRALSQGLPGTLTGSDAIVSGVLVAGSFTTQFFALVGATVALRWALTLGVQLRLPAPLRIGAALVSLGVCLVVFFSAQPRQFSAGPLILGGVGVAASVLLIAAAVRAALREQSRAAGLVGAACGASALLHLIARATAHAASGRVDAVQFEVARALASLAFLAEVAAVALAAVWVWRRLSPVQRGVGAVLMACVPALLTSQPATGFRLAVKRALEQLSVHPDPLVPLVLPVALHLAVLVLVTLSVCTRTGQACAAIIGLALLGRSSGDAPLGALLLSLSALILLLLDADSGDPTAPELAGETVDAT